MELDAKVKERLRSSKGYDLIMSATLWRSAGNAGKNLRWTFTPALLLDQKSTQR